MKKIPFTHIKFIGSALKEVPDFGLPEIALAGKSNVGKSSLINHLCRSQHLARVSRSPGKTQTLNFFNVDDACMLVDLPGYGYAKRDQKTQLLWAEALESYFQKRKSLKLILLLLDSRRLPSKEDLALADWAHHFHKPVVLIFTKSDTISIHQREENAQFSLNQLNLKDSMFYSIKDGKSRKLLIDKINLCLS
jgi:GTP-binding protein